MKHLCWIFCCLLLTPLSAQQFRHEIQCIVPATVIHLESSGSALLGGKSVEVIELDLPVNTLYWYYRAAHFTSEDAAKKALSTQDLSHKLEIILEQSDTLPVTLPYLNLPKGNTSGTIYLLSDSSDVKTVMERWRISRPSYIQNASSIAQNNAFKKIASPQQSKGKQYIAISNPSTLSQCFTLLEVVAVVKQEKLLKNQWKVSDLEKIKKEIIHELAIENDSTISPLSFKNIWQCVENQILEIPAEAFLTAEENAINIKKSLFIYRCTDSKISTQMALPSIPDEFFLAGNWISNSGEKFIFYTDNIIQLYKKDGRILNGQWNISQQVLTLIFPGYKEMHYHFQHLEINKLIWKEKAKGYRLELIRK